MVILRDADVILMPSAIERYLERFQEPDVVKCCGYMEIIDTDGKVSVELLPASLGRSGDYLYINLENSPNLY